MIPLPEPRTLSRGDEDGPIQLGYTAKQMHAYAAAAVAAERKKFPNLLPVIQWLENGCDPKEAAQELRIYEAHMRTDTA